MIVDIIPVGGLGRTRPICLEAAQIVIRDNLGTPICVAALYGMEGAIAVSKADDPEFNTVLHNLGIRENVSVDTIKLPAPPPGAVLVAGPPGR